MWISNGNYIANLGRVFASFLLPFIAGRGISYETNLLVLNFKLLCIEPFQIGLINTFFLPFQRFTAVSNRSYIFGIL